MNTLIIGKVNGNSVDVLVYENGMLEWDGAVPKWVWDAGNPAIIAFVKRVN